MAGYSDAAVATDDDSRVSESGELRLLAAVLELGVRDAVAGRRDALAWIRSDATGGAQAGWHYLDLAAALGLDAEWARSQVARGGVRARRPRIRRTRRLRAA